MPTQPLVTFRRHFSGWSRSEARQPFLVVSEIRSLGPCVCLDNVVKDETQNAVSDLAVVPKSWNVGRHDPRIGRGSHFVDSPTT